MVKLVPLNILLYTELTRYLFNADATTCGFVFNGISKSLFVLNNSSKVLTDFVSPVLINNPSTVKYTGSRYAIDTRNGCGYSKSFFDGYLLKQLTPSNYNIIYILGNANQSNFVGNSKSLKSFFGYL